MQSINKTTFNYSLQAFVYSSLFISLSAVTMTLSTYLILGFSLVDASPVALAFVFFSTLFIYNLNILSAKNESSFSVRDRWKFNNRKFLIILLAISLVGLAISCNHFSMEFLIYLGHLGLISVLYVYPVRIQNRTFSLRQFPLMKIFLISYVWASTTVVLPAMTAGSIESSRVLFLFVERFLFILAITIPFDVRDYFIDKKENILTLPGLFGICRSLYLSKIILISFVLISFLVQGFSYVTVTRLLCAVVAFMFIEYTHPRRQELFYLAGIDGLMIFHFIILALLKTLMA